MNTDMETRENLGDPVDTGSMFDWHTRQEAIQKLAELIKGINIAMLTTVDADGTLRSRPMATQEVEFNGELWFFTADDSAKAHEIARERQVNVSYGDAGKARYISVSGTAAIVHDRAKMEQLWNPILKAWFTEGLETENIALLRVDVDKAEYWDDGGRIMSLLHIARSLITGDRDGGGKNEKLDL
jgi:general stress protein 26